MRLSEVELRSSGLEEKKLWSVSASEASESTPLFFRRLFLPPLLMTASCRSVGFEATREAAPRRVRAANGARRAARGFRSTPRGPPPAPVPPPVPEVF